MCTGTGNEHTVILTSDEEVLTAGYNDNGQCGQGHTQRVPELARIPSLAGLKVKSVHACNGCEHTLVTCKVPALSALVPVPHHHDVQRVLVRRMGGFLPSATTIAGSWVLVLRPLSQSRTLCVESTAEL
jgi:hypothetical protein